MAPKDILSARERRLRRVASRKGLSIRKSRTGQDRNRYLIIIPETNACKSSHNRAYPNSFSLEEAETYLSE